MTASSLPELLAEVRACRACETHLPLGPRPIVQVGASARLVIIGQAPGRRVHESGIPWADPSGDRLRDWLDITTEVFYDPARVALVPMGFCYPGRGPSGDNPPRPECAPLWHDRLLARMPGAALTVLIGAYAQARYLPDRPATLTETVGRWRDRLPATLVIPHPSPRNQRWLNSNPWFEAELLPQARAHVRTALTSTSH